MTTMQSLDSFNCRRVLRVGNKSYAYYSLKAAEENGLEGISALPVSLKILLENLLRNGARFYNDHNQLTATDAGVTFSYNANGHTVTKVHNGQATEYLYNAEERLIEVTIDGQTVGRYAYNPYGQRIRKIVDGQTTWYLYNHEGLAAEYDANGVLIKEYHFKPYRPWMTEPLFQRTADGKVYYYQNDHLGTPQRMVSANGLVVWQAFYSAFGEAEIVVETVQNNLRFPGQYFDAESKLHHNFFRDYDSQLGRYIQEDPLGFIAGLNFYSYAGNGPITHLDSLGLQYHNMGDIYGGVDGLYDSNNGGLIIPGPSLPAPTGSLERRMGRAATLAEWLAWFIDHGQRAHRSRQIEKDTQARAKIYANEYRITQMQIEKVRCQEDCNQQYPHSYGPNVTYCSLNQTLKENCWDGCWDGYRSSVSADPNISLSGAN
jgi:RHS repeat-associated protein